jgi:hypothetical protein
VEFEVVDVETQVAMSLLAAGEFHRSRKISDRFFCFDFAKSGVKFR